MRHSKIVIELGAEGDFREKPPSAPILSALPTS